MNFKTRNEMLKKTGFLDMHCAVGSRERSSLLWKTENNIWPRVCAQVWSKCVRNRSLTPPLVA